MAQLKLDTTPEKAEVLRETLERANAACDFISERAWGVRVFQQWGLHGLTYREVRERFGLSAQMAVRCIAKVADAYKLDRKTMRHFKPHGAISYDDRILRYKAAKGAVSIWTLAGRIEVPYIAGPRQAELLKTQQGQSDLALIGGKFYLFANCNVEEPEPGDIDGTLGVDLGINNIASDSDGERFSGSHVKSVRHRNRRLRGKLQAIGTKSAKRRLKKRSGRESRFATHTNHTIAKRIVEKAKRTKRAIALEQLKGIRSRIRARRPQRATLHSWAFHQLGQFIKYKAALAGVPVVYVDPRNTSRECSGCGHVAKGNRDRAEFECQACGFAAHADTNAAVVIGRRAGVVPPNAEGDGPKSVHAGPHLQARI